MDRLDIAIEADSELPAALRLFGQQALEQFDAPISDRVFERIPASSGAGRAVGLAQHPPSVVGPDFVRNRLVVSQSPLEFSST